MGKSNHIKQLFEAINPTKNKKEILKDIETLANKVLKEHHTLDLFYKYSYFAHTPLEAAINTSSVSAFQLLIRLGADPFFRPKPDMPSAIEILAKEYFSLFYAKEKIPLFEWVMKDKESPVFTWAKLNSNQKLFNEFKIAGLIPKKQYINELPIHVAIEAGRMDLVRDVISAAGSIRRAGDISHMSILQPAILGVLEDRKNALEILKYLLKQGASTQTPDRFGLPAIMQAISAGVLYISNVKGEAVFDLVKLLLEHDAPLDITNPNNGHIPLMSAMMMGYKNLFYFLLGKADVKALNHQAIHKPNYLIFQLFDRHSNELGQLDILKLLSELKEKGLEFNKTIDYNSPADPFGDNSFSDGREVTARNMSLLHFYIDNMTHIMDDPFRKMDKDIEIIQTLIANGANPHAKATFTLTKNDRTQKVQTSIELKASEYVRKVADKIIDRYGFSTNAFLIKTYQDENEFLKNISYKTKEEQTSLHKKCHQFRNLERVLSGEKALPYSGLPDIGKTAKFALTKQKPSVEPNSVAKPKSVIETNDFEPNRFETELLNARVQQKQGNWQALKKSIVDYVKESESLQDFLARVEELKKPLQLHFNITTNSKGEVIGYGSKMYRFFHYFDSNKFPNSWETLRKFGQDTYGIDINTQYDQKQENQSQELNG